MKPPLKPLGLAIAGATGRIGSLVLDALGTRPQIRCVAALVSAGNAQLGRDAGEALGLGRLGVALSVQPEAPFDVLLDVSLAPALDGWLQLCQVEGAALVVGATGHSEEQLEGLGRLAERVAVLHAPNLAVGPNVLLQTLGRVAEQLGPGFGVTISEVHHEHKLDAPSATARALAQAIASSTGREPPISSLRKGQVAGQHQVTFRSAEESLSFTHRANSPALFAEGALRAIRWIAHRTPGLYSMQDLLGSPNQSKG